MLKRLIAFAGLLIASSSYAEMVVIVNPSNGNALDAQQVKRIFLGKDKKYPDGVESIPVNLKGDVATRQEFDQKVLGRSTSQVSAYWSKLVFTGKGIPPKEVSSDAEVIDIVSKNPSVIGYIDNSSVTGSVKVINL